MTWDQANAYWDRGAISTKNLVSIAFDLFDGGALQDVLSELEMIEPRVVRDFLMEELS